MIRTTRLAVHDTATLQIQRVARQLGTTETQAMSGQKINAPSDDPGAISEIHRLHMSIEDQGQYKENAQQAQDILSIMDGALTSIGDLVVRTREIATAMASETITATERAAAAVEIQAIYDELVALANTDIHGRYVFSGTAYDVPSFTAAGVYQGNNDTPATRVSDSQWLQTGLDGSQVFQGTTDLFASLTNMIANLNANNVPGVQASITDMKDATRQINQWHVFIGAETNAADDAINVTEGMSGLFSARLSSLISIDQTTTYVALSELRTTYESTLRVASTVTQTNLFSLM